MLLLGNWMMNLLKGLNSADEALSRYQCAPLSDASDAIRVFASAMATLVYALLGHNTERSFWVYLLQSGDGAKTRGAALPQRFFVH